MSYFDFAIAVLATIILFLYGLQSFSREIQLLGENRLYGALQTLTRNRFSGFILGAVFTAIVQSSSAVSALAVGLVDAGTITFANSLGVLIGTNVGTTATAWLVSLNLTWIGPIFIILGSLVTLMPGGLRVAGKSVFYFGFIFFALDLVGHSLGPLKQDPYFAEWLGEVRSPLIGGISGALVTALVQSSSVVTGLAILLVQQNTIDVGQAVAIIIGANAGTTVTGLIASIPMRPAAKRTAMANLLFNLAGMVLFLPFTTQLADFVTGIADTPGIAVACAHLLFNLGVAGIALPMVGPVARWLRPLEGEVVGGWPMDQRA